MEKRKENTKLSGGASSAKKPKERKLAVILTTRFGVIAIALPRSDGEKCEVVEEKFPFLGMRLHRWEKEKDCKLLLVGGQTNNFNFSETSEKIYELKVGRNLEIEIVESKSIKPLNDGKPLPLVQSFGDKLFVLHSNHSVFPYRGRTIYRVVPHYDVSEDESAFEVFEGVYWRFLPVPFKKLLTEEAPFGWYYITTSVRVPDKWYIFVISSSIEKSFVFDFAKEVWEEELTVLPQFSSYGLPYPEGEYFLVPEFDEYGYTILLGTKKMFDGELEPHLIAYLLDKQHRLLCYQVIPGEIFGGFFSPRYKDPNPKSFSSAFFLSG